MDFTVAARDLSSSDIEGSHLPPARATVRHRRDRATRPFLLGEDGTSVLLDVDRWHGEVDDVESKLLASVRDPVLDIGCGPGRIGAALHAAGRTVLGIDPAPTAVAWARARGAPALCRSVFDPLPEEGSWETALLLDGNIGIGGDPTALLARVFELLRPGGVVIAEVASPGGRTGPLKVRLRSCDPDSTGPWFPWARVSDDAFAPLAAAAGLVPRDTWHDGGRWFARADRP